MRHIRAAAIAIVLLALLALGYGWWRTQPTAAPLVHALPAAASAHVDRRALDDALALQPMAETPAERDLADRAAQVADHLLDLDYAVALREITDHPPPLSPEAKAAQSRLDAAAQQLVVDNAEVQRLAALRPDAGPDGSARLEASRALADLQFEIDQGDFAQAGRDLAAAGGDLRGQIEALIAEHHQTVAKAAGPAARPDDGFGLVHEVPRWWAERTQCESIQGALTGVNGDLERLGRERAALQARVSQAVRPAPTAESSISAQLATARARAEDHRRLSSLDERINAAAELRNVYAEWVPIAKERAAATLHRILLGGLWIAIVCLALLFVDGWVSLAVGKLHLDRRQIETLRTVSAVGLQLAAALFVAFVILGPPTQLSTFLGLAGAGLTVALKDFIVAFIGWLVLMGKNGIRLGDWVEIDGVSGEVVELGIFHTVLFETGNWTDAGHPTGRRVTFTNSFAIQGHYFNFSTSGQWLWDEVAIVVPAGQDVYPLVTELTKVVGDATADDAHLAEAEWRREFPNRPSAAPSAAPAVNVRPTTGGTQICIRYIARANDRAQVRSVINQAAVDALVRIRRPGG